MEPTLKLKDAAIHAVGWALSTNAFHSYFALGALGGIWYGLRETCGKPAAIGVVSVLVLAGVVYARTRG